MTVVAVWRIGRTEGGANDPVAFVHEAAAQFKLGSKCRRRLGEA